MNLINKICSYIGGQLEVQNRIKQSLFRGEIKDIDIKNNAIDFRLSWSAKGEGYPPMPHKWIKEDRLGYIINLKDYSLSDIGSNRIGLFARDGTELAVLFPKDGSRLEPERVEGLCSRLE